MPVRTATAASARQAFLRAIEMDPDSEIGNEALGQLRKEGRMAYWKAINLIDKDRQEALTMLEKACLMLPADDPYYAMARQKKEELQQSE